VVGVTRDILWPSCLGAKGRILNQHIFNVRHKETVNGQFFYWMLKKAVEQVEENLHGGVGLVHITKGNLERIEIPLPPLDEQERIVAELEGIGRSSKVPARSSPTTNLPSVLIRRGRFGTKGNHHGETEEWLLWEAR